MNRTRDVLSLWASRLAVRAWRRAVSPAGRHQFSGPGFVDPVRCAIFGDSEVYIDKYSYAQGLRVYSGAGRRVHIGRFCSIADNTTILVGGRHDLTSVTTSPWLGRLIGQARDASAGDVIVEHDVWIGHGGTITSGVTLATGSVVLAHAVVTRSTDPYEIVGGVPAKHVGWRFDDATRARLLDSRWWAVGEDELKILAEHVDNPEAFLDRLNQLRGDPLGNPL